MLLPRTKNLNNYKEVAKDYLINNLSDFKFELDHYGLKTKNIAIYRELKDEIVKNKGKIYNEVFWNKKNICSARLSNYIFEISEPKPNENISEDVLIDHVSFKTDNFTIIEAKLKDMILSRFDIKETHGIKISPLKDIIIEIRNNDLIESVKDFA